MLIIRIFILVQSVRLPQRLLNEPLQLAVHAPEFIRGPFFNSCQHFRINPQYKWFLF